MYQGVSIYANENEMSGRKEKREGKKEGKKEEKKEKKRNINTFDDNNKYN